MKLPSKNSMLFNGAAGLFILAGTLAIIKSVVMPGSVERCAARYGTITEFSLADSSGAALEPGDMQARLDGTEWGVLRNLRIEKIVDAPSDLIMRVGLTGAANAQAGDPDHAGGVGFRWSPGFLEVKSSACLSYNIWLPKGFDFRKGGLLPGMLGGGLNKDGASGKKGFAARFRWDENGKGGVRIETGDLQRYSSDARQNLASFRLPVGRWVNLEQEVTLNSPGHNDGLLRLWVDGKLVHEDAEVNFRKSADSRLLGVYADTRYLIKAHQKTGTKSQSVLITPFRLSWN